MRGRRYDIEVNGEVIRGVAHMLVTRMSRIAGGLKVSLPPLAENEYALWFARDVSRLGCLKLVWNMYRGKSCGEVRVLRGKTAFSSRSPVELEYDGDPHGNLPVVVSLAARPLRLIVPVAQKRGGTEENGRLLERRLAFLDFDFGLFTNG